MGVYSQADAESGGQRGARSLGMVVANPVHGWSNNAAEGSIKQARAGLIWSGVFMYGTSTPSGNSQGQ
jgi:hypothetical protein